MAKETSRIKRSLESFILLAALCCLVMVAGGISGCKSVSAQGAELKVSATIDDECRSHPGTFNVPEGKTAYDFKSGGLTPGKACRDGGAPENKGYAVRNQKNKPIYMWSQYKDQPPYEMGGPLSSLSLGSGEYTLSVAGGAGAKIELTYKLK